MEWSGQQSQTPQSAQQPAAGSLPAEGYYSANPLVQPGINNPLAAGQGSGVATPNIPVAPVAMSGNGLPPAMAPPVSLTSAPNDAQSQLDDNLSDSNDAAWVDRAKRAIASSHGDPHRQVQLIQHLRSQYLNQRFGRTIHTDKA